MKINNSKFNRSSKSVKNNKAKKSGTWFSWLTASKSRVVMVSVFGLIGVVSLIGVNAAEYTKAIDPNQIIAGIYNEAPTIITPDPKTKKPIYQSVAESKFVLADGSIICDNASKTGLVKVGDISAAKLAQIKKEAKVVRTDKRVKEKTDVPLVNNASGVIVSEKGAGKNVTFDKTNTKSETVLELEASLNQHCSQDAVESVEREDATEPQLPNVNQSSAPTDKGWLNQIGSVFVGTAHAAPPTNAGVAEYGYRDNQAGLTNQYRGSKGLYTFRTGGCIEQAAWGQAKRMVEAGFHYHNPNLLNEILWHCNKEGANGDSWRFVSENVGNDNRTGSQALFDAYKASRDHNLNLLNTNARCQGHAAYRHKVSGKVFHVMVTGRWVGGPCG